jgi:hypothetical protein
VKVGASKLSKIVRTISGARLVFGPDPSILTESEQGSVASSRVIERDLMSRSMVSFTFGGSMFDS